MCLHYSMRQKKKKKLKGEQTVLGKVGKRLHHQPRQKSRKDKGERRKWEEQDMSWVKFEAYEVHFLFTWLMLLSKDLLVCMWE